MYNTYVMTEGFVALRNHLDTKTVLMESPELHEEYECVKSKLEKI